MTTIPEDIATAPFWVLNAYVEEFNRASAEGTADPDKAAREKLAQLWSKASARRVKP